MKHINHHPVNHPPYLSSLQDDQDNQERQRPIIRFMKWFDLRTNEHQLELAEFIGKFCYAPLFSKLKTSREKIFAFKEFLRSKQNDYLRSNQILLFIDDVMEFIVDINTGAENILLSMEELLNELSGITSLETLETDPDGREKKWTYTYLQWHRFREEFLFLGMTDKRWHRRVKPSKNINLHPDSSIINQGDRDF